MNTCTSKSFREQLRERVFPWSLAFLITTGALIAIFDPRTTTLASYSALGLLMLTWAAIVWFVNQHRHLASAWLLCFGIFFIILLSWYWFPSTEVQSALMLPSIIAIILIGPGAGALMSLTTTIAMVWAALSLPFGSGTPATLIAGTITLWGSTVLLIVAQHAQMDQVRWAWDGYRQAWQSLEAARDRQFALKQALADLDLAHRELIRLNELLAAAREALEETRRAKEEFVAMVSHELRTPLNMIIGFSDEIIERPHVYNGQIAKLLDDVTVIRRNSEHLARLVDDVLDLAEVDSGQMRLSKGWTSIGEIISEATTAVAPFFQKKGLYLRVDVQADLPLIFCDHFRVRQVVLNLLSNAARFTQEGGAAVKAVQQNEAIIVTVTDSGPGIEANALKHLFEPFQQAEPFVRRQHGGTGLGLAISKRFISMHGGNIWIESELDTGTCVSFTLPLELDMPKPDSKRWFNPYQEYMTKINPSLAPRSQEKPRIVVIEQGNELSELIERYIEDIEAVSVKGLEQDTHFLDTAAATAIVVNKMPAVISPNLSTDLSLLALDVPIIFCWVPQRRTLVTQMGVQDYLVKPIRRDDLLESIARCAPDAHRILVVDDDDEARRLFSRMLTTAERHYILAEATDGQTALTLMKEWHPDVVLLDLIMPNQDGFAVLDAKEKDEIIKEIPIIIISAKDPQREPIVSNAIVLSRQSGFSERDLAMTIEAALQVLPPRFAAPAPLETPRRGPVSG